MAFKRYLILIGIILFVFILMNINLQKMLSILVKADIIYVLLAILIIIIIPFFKGLKWKTVINAHKLDYPLKNCIFGWLSGFFLGIITPTRIGDLAKSFYLSEDKDITIGAALSTVVVDRLIDVALILFLGFFSIVGFLIFLNITVISLPLILIIVIGFIVAVFLFTKERYVKIILRPFFNTLVPERLKGRISFNFSEFYKTIKEVKKGRLLLIKAILIGIFVWFLSIISVYLLVLSLDINVPFYFIVLVVPLTVLMELLPISIFGFGTREATLLFLFSIYSLSAETIIALSLLVFLIANLVPAIIGLICFIKRPINLKGSFKAT